MNTLLVLFSFGFALSGESPASHMPPVYPQAARDGCIEGIVQLQIEVGENGTVADATVLSASPEGYFEEAALVNVRRWRFNPETHPSGRIVELGMDFSFGDPCVPVDEAPNNALERSDEG